MKNKLFVIFFSLGLFCGKAQALPQDWPCDVFELSIDGISKYSTTKEEPKTYQFRGNNGRYEVTIFEHFIDPDFVNGSCGNIGCSGKIKDLNTGKEESMYFDCGYNQDTKMLLCDRISGDEYVFTKFSDNEYRVELCSGKDYLYILKSECDGCSCFPRDPKPDSLTNWPMKCLQEDDKLHCFTYHGYEAWRNYKSDLKDFENCVGLGI